MIIYEISVEDWDSDYIAWRSYGEYYVRKEAAQAAVDRLNANDYQRQCDTFLRNLREWAQRDTEELALIRLGLRPKRTKPFSYTFKPRKQQSYRVDEVEVFE